ncbi:MAG TPA: hypothetical protein VEA38_03720, partial [Terriglobales bacterium]|nr:hypothetical protein [Terriglobales bacterium]
RALRAGAPAVRLFGMGGPRMAAAGMEVLEDVTRHAAVGGTEAAARGGIAVIAVEAGRVAVLDRAALTAAADAANVALVGVGVDGDTGAAA